MEALGLPTTILRPTFFITDFEHLGPHWQDGELVFTLALAPQTRLQMITPGDIGAIAADVFDAPAEYLGRTIEVAADELTGPQKAETFDRAAGRPVRFNAQPVERVRAFSEEMAAMFEWFDNVGFRADLDALRGRHPDLTTLDAWVSEHWSVPAVSTPTA
ncbi:NmrA family NAD(P)-binding protein [Streptomyces sp. NPDC057287]|uniref:NmrA family NAD(P)-binding protein n=1 Tax=Streptomyces sp. NPDC057287 TaxID=3346086 RepID=UPI003629AF87